MTVLRVTSFTSILFDISSEYASFSNGGKVSNYRKYLYDSNSDPPVITIDYFMCVNLPPPQLSVSELGTLGTDYNMVKKKVFVFCFLL